MSENPENEQQSPVHNGDVPVASEPRESQAADMESSQPKRELSVDTIEFMKLLGRVLSSADLYGLDHKMTVGSLEESFDVLTKVFEQENCLDLNMVENRLFINGLPLEIKNPLVSAFIDRLRTLDIAGFRLSKGMSADEYVRLLLLFTSRGGDEDNTFADAVTNSGLEHVTAKTSTIQVVEEGQVVVDEDQVSGSEDGGYDDPSVKQIVAFLKGGASSGPPESLGDIDTAANNADKLADLIMEAVTIRQRSQPAGGESLGDLVVGCLRRTFDGLSSGRAAKTKKGKKQLSKTLAVLEKSVLERLRAVAGEDYQQAAEELSEAAETLQDEVKMDAVTSEFLKKQAAAEASEARIIRMMKSKGLDNLGEAGLKERLMEGGLTESGWQKLVVESGMSDGDVPNTGADTGSDAGMLAGVLEQFTTLMESVKDMPDLGSDSSEVDNSLEEIKTQVDGAIDKTDRKIDKLAEAKEKKSVGNMLELLPEIVQELCQPLSVINCTIDMARARSFGEMSNNGLNMFELAADSGKRLQKLIDRLADICGMPDTMGPDKEKIDTIYKRNGQSDS